MKTLILLAAAGAASAAALAAPATAAQPRERAARCVITAPQVTPYRGACRFQPLGGGSFALRPAGRRFLVGDVTDVTVEVVRRGAAEVRGLTSGGINSRWGSATRSQRDGACWVGSDFTICAY